VRGVVILVTVGGLLGFMSVCVVCSDWR